MLSGESGCAKPCVGSQNIINIVKAFIIGYEMLIFNCKGKLLAYLISGLLKPQDGHL